jgi:serine protease Do
LDITGIVLSAPDGQTAWFDHVYLARSVDDFQFAPPAPSPELTNQKARDALAQPVVEKAAPACVALDFGSARWGTGTIVEATGTILTAGHLVLGPDKPVTVHLADGRTLAAKTRGVFREADLGVVQLAEPGPYPFIALDNVADLPISELYVALLHKRAWTQGQRPLSDVIGVRRMLRDAVWADWDVPEWTAGGPLLNRNAKLVAVHTRRSGFGGFLYSKLANPAVYLGRLKNGEVWGAWQLGAGPLLGVVITTTAEGCKVIEVMPDLAAAKQGILVGDFFRKVNGRPVLTLDDVYQALAEKDAGQDVEVEYTRGKEGKQVRIGLGARFP